ncbi:dTMP kinase [Wenzhouxiangella sp. AB-CW3]|uniref:dTMP kinase n=1 Tax=Wenzhouxiangella sp. AB-CW3 TaxID=2771012 RepID=UPI00168AE7B2|nr:dTMP kinase [Wenzhouxiangella sp. AB-CW3]QOC24007.1 dTMP kinase [Wenzhouxiangella sp. AB-CW3]
MSGFFLTLEGGEGAGKTTALTVISEWLESRGRPFLLTREPGGTQPGERIRELLLDPDTGGLAPMTELMLMFAARNEHMARVIRPGLAAGKVVVSDRFTDASMAYQGAGRGLGRAPVEALSKLVHPDRLPDLTLLLDVPVEQGLARIRGRSGGPDRFEQSESSFMERVRSAYLEQAQLEPERFVVIDAARPLQEVSDRIRAALQERLA